jgi:predicted enzyme related to lactoylglutathione lyase
VAHQTPGKFGWIDLGTTDTEAGKKFYTKLFGWKADSQPVPEGGTYTLFTKGGKMVAGLGDAQQGMPPMWSSYVIVDDADAVEAKAKELGGQVLMGAIDVMDTGRMAIIADPTGAVFGVWQPKTHKGAEVFNEHGSLTWNELSTKGLDKAKSFYEKLFGWNWQAFGDSYFVANVDGQPTAGAQEMGSSWPEGTPPHWDVYLHVDDPDAAAAQVKKLGGKVLTDAIDAPGAGRFYMVQDPAGAMFYIMKPVPAPAS